MGFWSENDEANDFYNEVWRNACDGLDANGKPFDVGDDEGDAGLIGLAVTGIGTLVAALLNEISSD